MALTEILISSTSKVYRRIRKRGNKKKNQKQKQSTINNGYLAITFPRHTKFQSLKLVIAHENFIAQIIDAAHFSSICFSNLDFILGFYRQRRVRNYDKNGKGKSVNKL